MSQAAGAVPLLRLAGVGKTFDNGIQALAGVDIDVGSGDFLTLLGPSGCGKSTLLRLIAGLERDYRGAMLWRGGEVADTGFVFQDPTLMPWANVFSNVWLPLRLRGVGRRAAAPAVEAALALVGLGEFTGFYPRQLSGGMKMRVSIARALVSRPALLLLDEPFAALDEIARFKLNDDLLRLKRELGTTIIFVTHSIYESIYLATRVAIFSPRPGRIVEIIDVDQSLPRNEEFRVSQIYAEYCARAARALRGAAAEVS